MNILQTRSFRIGLLAVLLGFLGFHIKSQSGNGTLLGTRAASSNFPPEGLPLNDTGGRVPGNPNNGIQDLQKIHQLIGIYYRKNGKYPKFMMELLDDIKREPQAYGVSRREDIMVAFTNPDSRFSDYKAERQYATQRNTTYVPYGISDKRPDGAPIGGAKPQGKRDILAWTDLYVHQNIRHFKGERSTSNPVGFYLVLWDDGQVEKVPYDQRLFVPEKPGFWTYAFPGQAGVPSNILTYDQFHRSLGAKEGPRGKPGGKGVSYKGSSIP